MDVKKSLSKIQNIFLKYRYAILIVLIGIAFMLLPTKSETTVTVDTSKEAPAEQSIEQQMESVLSQIRDVGNVQVLLTVAVGEEVVYQTNSDTSNSDTTASASVDTVTINSSDRNEVGLVRQVNPPKYLGAVVVCQGADDPNVKLAIVDAVSKLTGLGANQISVLKMK